MIEDRNGREIKVGSRVFFKLDKEGHGTVTELREFEGWRGPQVTAVVEADNGELHDFGPSELRVHD